MAGLRSPSLGNCSCWGRNLSLDSIGSFLLRGEGSRVYRKGSELYDQSVLCVHWVSQLLGWASESASCVCSSQGPSPLLSQALERRDDVTGRRGNSSEANCQPPSKEPLLQEAVRGEMLGQRQLPTGDRAASHPLVRPRQGGPWSWSALPCGAERDRQHLWGQTYPPARSGIYENRSERGTQSNPSFHLQLPSPGAY
ncbi:hypothetical protein D623_10035336 [Myotis brandtii]|uniref:Uncharacterized protein n=1 Tax=Myotis brandtii TaxID=109478 RepID=S7MMQ7_MYOBR|nr:hypothetical protein D623_10035336 [Myotis brandtii]